MAKIKRDPESTQLYFQCPGCGHLHAINDSQTDLRGEKRPVWEFNGDFDKPTIRASVLNWSYRKNPDSGKYDIEIDRCHSFITDGMIQYLDDCQHKLAGQTIELPEID
ncbi:MAG: hypothetical protein JJE45_00495 [Prolixibacteraceae bacterium]|nr:hypothetical protein [Prolixibacteraceae bacterium]